MFQSQERFNTGKGGQNTEEYVSVILQRLERVEQQVKSQQDSLDDLEAAELPPIIQIFRNTDFTYSLRGYLDSAAGGGDENEELAYFFAHAKDEQITVRDGAITSGTGDFNSQEAVFTAGDIGKTIIIDGAGAGGDPHLSAIDGFTDANNIHIADNAVTTVTNARARYGCQKLGKKNKKTDPGDVLTDIVKCDSHTNYGAGGNLTSPEWNKTQGEIKFGNTNTLTYFHGTFSSTGTFFPSIPPFRAGNEVWVLFKMALKNKFIKPKGYLYAGLWDNSDTALEFLRSSDLVLEAAIIGTPAATDTAQYFVIAHASNGRVYKSNILSVPDAPDRDSFNPPECQVNLSWTYIPNIIQLQFFRKYPSENVYLLETVDSGISSYFDVNYGGQEDTGTTDFPAVSAADLDVPCLAQTNDFRSLVANGAGDWVTMYLKIPVTPTTNFSAVTELALRLGLSEDLAFEVSGCTVAAGFIQVTAPENCFEAGMVGCAVTLRESVETGVSFTAEVLNYVSPTVIELNASVPFSSSDVACEIAFGDEHGIFIDLFGVSFNRGKWAKHPDDDTRTLPTSSLPPTTSQGGGTSGGGGGIGCVTLNRMVQRYDPDTGRGRADFARNFKAGDYVYYGRQYQPNKIKSVEIKTVYGYFEVDIAGIWGTEATAGHRFVKDIFDIRNGTPLEFLESGAEILPSLENVDILETINKRFIACPNGIKVISFIMEDDINRPDECRLFIVDNILSHNQKTPDVFL